MDHSYYRVSGQVQQHLVSSGIHFNKDFIGRPGEWFPPHFKQAPTTMYNNTNQYPPSGYASSYPVYQNYGAGYNYPGYGYQESQSNQPVSSGGFSQSNWTPINQPNYSVPPPQPPGEAEGKTDAVVQEIQQQKATLTKQREDYVRKALVLRRESEQLRQQKQQLADGDMSDRELLAVLRKNEKLQEEINGKLKAILNVVEMLSTIIRDGKKIGDLEAELEQEERNATYTKQQSVESNRYSPSSIQTERSREPESRERNQLEKEVDKRYCYVYYDTGLHWCRACDEFPETAKEYLQHLQNKDHQDMAKENEVDITPWHKLPLEPVLPSYDDAPKKRLPIKGLQFFISAPSWYCKLCDVWIGDLHCASHHLKSVTHSQNYKNFVEQNPHWETEWLKDRETAMTRNGKHHSSDSDSSTKKKKRKHRASIESFLKEKKKKKRSKKKRKDSSDSSSSSSSSESSSDDEDSKDRSKSIRVAMRNMTQVKSIINEDMSKWTVLEKLLEDHRKKDNTKISNTEDELINQWMTVADPSKEKNIIETLKDRMRVKQEVEKAKWAEMEKRRKEKERQEQEMLEMKERQMREEAERLEREKARREQEEYQRIVDKDNRGHVKFRPSRDHYRRRKSASDDEEEEKRHRVNESPKHRREHESQYSKSRHSPEHKNDSSKRRPPGPPSYKKLPFIGRMPLFKKKQDSKNEKEEKVRSIKKEEYEPQRKTRFEVGNLARAFIPKPDVVCFPVLSSIPPISAPPPPPAAPVVLEKVELPSPKREKTPLRAPDPPSIKEKQLVPPPPPKVKESDIVRQEPEYPDQDFDHNAMGEYYESFNNMMYQTQQYEYEEEQAPLPHPPLEPPPLPPDDDLALLGICADDMAAQSF